VVQAHSISILVSDYVCRLPTASLQYISKTRSAAGIEQLYMCCPMIRRSCSGQYMPSMSLNSAPECVKRYLTSTDNPRRVLTHDLNTFNNLPSNLTTHTRRHVCKSNFLFAEPWRCFLIRNTALALACCWQPAYIAVAVIPCQQTLVILHVFL
jgi:hypothetical protein